MSTQNQIEKLQSEIDRLRYQQEKCKHEWGEPKYDPETVKVPYGFKLVGKGSDVWTEPQGYEDKTKDRWSRECKSCGYKQYTYEQEPVISNHKPKFPKP